jgi:hypothetical protein
MGAPVDIKAKKRGMWANGSGSQSWSAEATRPAVQRRSGYAVSLGTVDPLENEPSLQISSAQHKF